MEQLDRKFEEMFGNQKTHTVQIPESQEQSQYNPWNCSTFGYQEKTKLAEIPEEDQQENPIVIDLKHDRKKDAYDA